MTSRFKLSGRKQRPVKDGLVMLLSEWKSGEICKNVGGGRFSGAALKFRTLSGKLGGLASMLFQTPVTQYDGVKERRRIQGYHFRFEPYGEGLKVRAKSEG